MNDNGNKIESITPIEGTPIDYFKTVPGWLNLGIF